MSVFIATLEKSDLTQNFVFPGTMSLDEIFGQIAEKDRAKGMFELAYGSNRIHTITISRDQASEPVDVPLINPFGEQRSDEDEVV